MDIRDHRELKAAAEESLAANPGHRKTVLLYAGVAAGLSLAVSLLNFLLEGRIADTGGIAGLGLRSILSTVQSLLGILVNVLLPFWSLGYVAATLGFSRRQQVSPGTLLEGFHRFGPALRLLLLRGALYMAAMMAAAHLGMIVLSFTPLVDQMYAVAEQLLDSGLTAQTVDQATLNALMEAMTPMLLVCGIIALIAVIPISYRLRLAEFRLMDTPCGAIRAMAQSNRMMRGNCLALLRLDLSFWWYYAAELLLVAVGYADVLLPTLGVELPMGADVAFFLFYALSLGLQLILYWQVKNRVAVTYAKVYEALSDPGKDNVSFNII